MLQEVHKRLSLSVDGGKISLWNIQEGILEFDDNYTQLVGLEQRRFTKEDMIQYTCLLYTSLSTVDLMHSLSNIGMVSFCF